MPHEEISDTARAARDITDAITNGNVVDVEGTITADTIEMLAGAMNVMQTPDPLVVRINTLGGDGLAMIDIILNFLQLLNETRDNPRRHYALIDGVCQSAGMFLALNRTIFSGVFATPDSQLAFHYLTPGEGQAALTGQEFLYKLLVADGLKTADPDRTWESWLEDIRANRKYSAREALTAGLIDGIITDEQLGAQ